MKSINSKLRRFPRVGDKYVSKHKVDQLRATVLEISNDLIRIEMIEQGESYVDWFFLDVFNNVFEIDFTS